MSWTYSLISLATSPKDQVRAAIQDIDPTNQLLQDEEISFFLTLRSSVFGASAECCRALAAKFSSQCDIRAGDTEQKFSAVAKSWMLRAQQFDQRAAMTGSGMPYTGGISVSDKQRNEEDQDRINPEFARGMFDNNLPIGQSSLTSQKIGQTDENT